MLEIESILRIFILSHIQSNTEVGSCDWERHDWCNYAHGDEDDFDWKLQTTPEGSGFVNIDTSMPDSQNQHSRLFTPFIHHKVKKFYFRWFSKMSKFIIRNIFMIREHCLSFI